MIKDTEPKERNFNFFRFEDLRIYHKSLDYVKWVYEAVEQFPQSEKIQIGASFIKAATSISINIAEGSGRSKSQFIYYLKMAKSSIRECVVLSTIAHLKGLLLIEKEEESRNFLIEISKMLGALISSLQHTRKTDSGIHENEDENDDETFS